MEFGRQDSWTERARIFRAWPWLVMAALLLFGVIWVSPTQALMLLWSLAKLSLAAYLGYWLDRTLFPYARPHDPRVGGPANAMLRRAIIVAAVVIGLALGV